MSQSTTHGVTQGHKLLAGGEDVSYWACCRNSNICAQDDEKRKHQQQLVTAQLFEGTKRSPGGGMGAMGARSERSQVLVRPG